MSAAAVMHLVAVAGPGTARAHGCPVAECPACRRVYDAAAWVALPFVGALAADADHEVLVVRECTCRVSFGLFVVEAARCAGGT